MRNLFLIGALLTSVTAQADLETQIGLGSKHLFRGQNLSSGQISLKAGFDADYYGFYVGGEAATINVEDDYNGQYDFYSGYTFGIGSVAFGLGTSVHRFERPLQMKRFQPDADSKDLIEYTASMAYDGWALNYYAEQEERYNYSQLRKIWGISSDFSMEMNLGHYQPEVGDESSDIGLTFVAGLQNDAELTFTVNYIAEFDDYKGESNVLLQFNRRFGY